MHVVPVGCCRLRFTAFVVVSDRDIHIRRRIRAHRRSSSCSPLQYTAVGVVFGGDIHMQSPRLTHSVSIRIAFGCPHAQTAGLATFSSGHGAFESRESAVHLGITNASPAATSPSAP
jgi:hypothetical protein